MKKLLLFFMLAGYGGSFAQQIPLQTFITGGAATFTSGSVSSFGVIGQPMVMPRNTAASQGGGVAVAADLMFSVSVTDEIPPQISSSPAPSLTLTKNQTSTVSAVSTDAPGGGVVSVYLYHRPIAAGGTYDSTALTRTSGDAFNGTYTFNVNTIQDEYDDMGMEYYLKARDSKNNVRYPASGTLKAYTNFTSLVFPSNVLTSFGEEVNNYHIIAFPFEPSNPSVPVVMPQIAPLDPGTDYRLFRYQNGSYQEYPNTFTEFERARGYFFIARSSVFPNMGNQVAPSNHRSDLEQISLQSGWNLIGNPYPVTINWNDVKTLNGFSANAKTWNGVDFVDAGDILPFQGVFVNANSATPLTIPFKGQTAVGGRTESISSDIASERWVLPITFNKQPFRNSLNGIGMHPEASIELDNHDDFHPPHFAGFAELRFPHPEHRFGSYARDVVPTQAEYIWRFTADASDDGEGELQWNNTDLGSSNLELYLYDVRTNTVVNMRDESRYAFTTSRSKEFKIYFGTNVREKIGPDMIESFTPYPNPFGKKNPVTFAIGLPNTQDRYPVEVVVRNSMGAPVFTTANTFTPGVHEITWDGRQPDGQYSAQGFYVYTVTIGSRQFTGKVMFLNHE